MRAVVVGPGGGLRVESRPLSAPAPELVRVAVAFGGICGSDLHYAYQGRNGPYEVVEPLILGHEIVGRVSAVGDSAGTRVAVGTPVAIHPATPTPPPGGTTGAGYNLLPGTYLGSAAVLPHAQGGFADFIDVLPVQLREIPPALPLRRAVLAEPLAIALHGVSRLGGRVSGARVLVSGAGPIGCLAILALRHAGAAVVVAADLQEQALATARKVGADDTIHVGRGTGPGAALFDISVEAAGVPASLSTAIALARPGGAVLQLGMLPSGPLTVELAGLVARELTLLGSQRMDVELDQAIRILAADPAAEAVITHEFPVGEAVAAFACAADPARSSKVILKFAGG